MLEDIGFRLWRDVYVVCVKDPALIDASLELLESRGPVAEAESQSDAISKER